MVTGLASTAGAALVKPEAFVAALGWSLMWVLAPFVAHRASIPRPVRVADPPTAAEQEALRLIARRTWRYFETFVTSEDNWLPPDNYQEDPAQVAHRTSPTNIGLYLLSVLSAREFGWIGIEDAVGRLEVHRRHPRPARTIRRPLSQLVRHRHRANPSFPATCRPWTAATWPDTCSPSPKGAHACKRWSPAPKSAAGIRDVVVLIREAADRLATNHEIGVVSPRELDGALSDLLASLDSRGTDGGRAAGRDPGQRRNRGRHRPHPRHGRRRRRAGDLGRGAGGNRARAPARPRAARRSRPAATFSPTASAALAAWAAEVAEAMDFSFLMDPENKLLAIGYRPSDYALDESHYDLLASEARLASFVGIAKGELPPSHWFRLGRSMTPMGARRRPDLMVGFDVRIPDAAAGDAIPAREHPRHHLSGGGPTPDRIRQRSPDSRGGSPKRPTPPATSGSSISTRPSGSRASDSSAA